jgi:hypothetical protein
VAQAQVSAPAEKMVLYFLLAKQLLPYQIWLQDNLLSLNLLCNEFTLLNRFFKNKVIKNGFKEVNTFLARIFYLFCIL